MNVAHSGFSSLRLGASWSVVDDIWLQQQRQLCLYAILVVKLEGKAPGIVQLVNKGEGLEAWRQLKLEYEGKAENKQAALLRGNLNPRAAWETDTKDARSVVESLNKWEKTIGL